MGSENLKNCRFNAADCQLSTILQIFSAATTTTKLKLIELFIFDQIRIKTWFIQMTNSFHSIVKSTNFHSYSRLQISHVEKNFNLDYLITYALIMSVSSSQAMRHTNDANSIMIITIAKSFYSIAKLFNLLWSAQSKQEKRSLWLHRSYNTITGALLIATIWITNSDSYLHLVKIVLLFLSSTLLDISNVRVEIRLLNKTK